MTRPCDQTDKLEKLAHELDKATFKLSVFVALIVVFLLLVGTAVARSEVAVKEARATTDELSRQVTKQAVMEEKLDWLKQATIRIEKKLDGMSGGK